jgi:APA family basic amino acid/polyamine antiporter
LVNQEFFIQWVKMVCLPKFLAIYTQNLKLLTKQILLFLVIVGLFAAFVPGDIVGDMTSIGTLFAFSF